MVAKGAAVPLGGACGWLGVVCGWCWVVASTSVSYCGTSSLTAAGVPPRSLEQICAYFMKYGFYIHLYKLYFKIDVHI